MAIGGRRRKNRPPHFTRTTHAALLELAMEVGDNNKYLYDTLSQNKSNFIISVRPLDELRIHRFQLINHGDCKTANT